MDFRFTIFLLFFLLTFAGRAEKGPKNAHSNQLSRQGCVQFKFNNQHPDFTKKDSVLLIFDRYDRTGAGVIYQVFYMDKDGNINLPSVLAGKYYVTIQCLGLHRDRIEKLVRICPKKNRQVKVCLRDSEEFSKEKVVIPAFQPKFSDMAILKMK